MLVLDEIYAAASGSGEAILNGISLELGAGEIHAIMGPNGAGKSTLCHVLAGSSDYEISAGSARLNGEELLSMSPEQRAISGLFMSFQYPVEIPGVPVLTFVRTTLNAIRRARGEDEMSAPEFLKKARAIANNLQIPPDMLKRALNVGFSGGEKKRLEIFQILMLEPRCLILDETDSGLDIDALRLVAESIKSLRSPDRAMLVITHYQRLLEYIDPDRIYVMIGGKISVSGGPELAAQLEREGYASLAAQPDMLADG